MAKSSGASSVLTLGWKVTAQYDPGYWLRPSAKPGKQSKGDLVTVRSESMAHHLVVVAQSGAGKSAFLGRLVEELMLNTKARCLILDPNADFRRMSKIETKELWSKASYDLHRRTGKLPHESNQQKFEELWSRVKVKILAGGNVSSLNKIRMDDEFENEPARIWWPGLSVDFLAYDLGSVQRSMANHCHQLVAAFADYQAKLFPPHVRSLEDRAMLPVTDTVETLLDRSRHVADKLGSGAHHSDIGRELLRTLMRQYNIGEKTIGEILAPKVGGDKQPLFEESKALVRHLMPISGKDNPEAGSENRAKDKLLDILLGVKARGLYNFINKMAMTTKYIAEDMARFYFGKLREYEAAGIVTFEEPDSNLDGQRLRVLDLPSFEDRHTGMLVVNGTLASEWRRAREEWEDALRNPQEEDERIPTFIVVDEAHNVAPAQPRDRTEHALREQIRTFAAEGRKYGLFLILVSQRPDKLDPLVVSECQNKAIMSLSSNSILESTCSLLGIEEVSKEIVRKSLVFGKGRAAIVGPWAGGMPQIIYCAARRTVEGGRNLNAQHWTCA